MLTPSTHRDSRNVTMLAQVVAAICATCAATRPEVAQGLEPPDEQAAVAALNTAEASGEVVGPPPEQKVPKAVVRFRDAQHYLAELNTAYEEGDQENSVENTRQAFGGLHDVISSALEQAHPQVTDIQLINQANINVFVMQARFCSDIRKPSQETIAKACLAVLHADSEDPVADARSDIDEAILNGIFYLRPMLAQVASLDSPELSKAQRAAVHHVHKTLKYELAALHLNAGTAYLGMGEPDIALSHFGSSFDSNPHNPKSRVQSAYYGIMAAEQAGEPAAAMEFYSAIHQHAYPDRRSFYRMLKLLRHVASHERSEFEATLYQQLDEEAQVLEQMDAAGEKSEFLLQRGHELLIRLHDLKQSLQQSDRFDERMEARVATIKAMIKRL